MKILSLGWNLCVWFSPASPCLGALTPALSRFGCSNCGPRIYGVGGLWKKPICETPAIPRPCRLHKHAPISTLHKLQAVSCLSPVLSPPLIPPAGTTWTRRQSPALLMEHQGTGDKQSIIHRGPIPAAWRGSKERWEWCLTQPPGSAEQEEGAGMTQEMLFVWGQVGSGE